MHLGINQLLRQGELGSNSKFSVNKLKFIHNLSKV